MIKTNHQCQQPRPRRHADYSVRIVWLALVLLTVAILPFAVRNSEIVRQIAAMCGLKIA